VDRLDPESGHIRQLHHKGEMGCAQKNELQVAFRDGHGSLLVREGPQGVIAVSIRNPTKAPKSLPISSISGLHVNGVHVITSLN